jgi:hypothetical protein
MTGEQFTPDGLDRRVAALITAESPTAVFKILLEGAGLAAPRAAVYLLRQGGIKGWGTLGFGTDAAQRQRQHMAAADEGWLGSLAASDEPLHETGSPGPALEFGQPASDEWYGIPVRVKQRPIALIVAERSAGVEPWHPGVLRTLVRIACMRLELDLLRRKLGIGPTASPPTDAAPAESSEAPAAPEPSELQEEAPPPAVDEKRLEAARRYARLVATDIRLYNEEAVMQGRRGGDLVQRLGDHLGRGKETFLRRHGSLGPTALQILHDAYVQVLAAGDEQLMPRTVLD